MPLTLTAQHWNIPPYNRPDDSVIHVWILMSQLIAKVHNSTSMYNTAEYLLRHAIKGHKSFADDDELTLYRGPNEPVAFVALQIEAPDCVGDSIACLDHIR